MQIEKIAVLGAGAIGSSIGASLTKAGYDVLLIDQWPAHVEAMKTRGLRIVTWEKVSSYPVRAVHLCDLVNLKPQFDLVFLACKTVDSSWMAQFIEPYLKPDGILVPTQNSVPEEWISPIIGANRIIGCAVELSASVFEPGVVRRYTDESTCQFAIGELDGKNTPRLQEVAKIMSSVGKVHTTSNIWGAKWTKLIHSTASLCLSPIVGLGKKELLEPPYHGLSIKIGSETARVAGALGIQLEPVFGFTKEDFNCSVDEKVLKILDGIGGYLLAAQRKLGGEGYAEIKKSIAENSLSELRKKGTEGAISSTLQDLLKERITETRIMNGLVSKKGREVGIPTPVNDAVVSIMKEIEQGKRKMMDISNFEMLKPFVH
jgi:2-dehydropantoate 2-reductase